MKSGRLSFAKFNKNDFELYFRLMGNENVMKMISGEPLAIDEAKIKFERVLRINEAYPEIGYFVVREIKTSHFIGLAKIVVTEGEEAEIGYALLPAYWGLGYGSEISEKLVEKAQSLDFIKNLVAIIDPLNEASKRILKKSDFIFEKSCEIDGLPGEIYRLKLPSTSSRV